MLMLCRVTFFAKEECRWKIKSTLTAPFWFFMILWSRFLGKTSQISNAAVCLLCVDSFSQSSIIQKPQIFLFSLLQGYCSCRVLIFCRNIDLANKLKSNRNEKRKYMRRWNRPANHALLLWHASEREMWDQKLWETPTRWKKSFQFLIGMGRERARVQKTKLQLSLNFQQPICHVTRVCVLLSLDWIGMRWSKIAQSVILKPTLSWTV